MEESIKEINNTISDVPKNERTAGENIEYAGFWIRFLALIIDMFPIYTVSLLFAPIYILITKAQPNKIFSYTVGFIVVWGYFILMTYKYQATLGKKVVGIRVIPEENEDFSFGKVLVRETIGRILSGILLGFGYWMVGFSKRKQGWHDKFAGTVVVYVSHSRTKGFLMGFSIVVISVILMFFLTFSFLKIASSDQGAKDDVSVAMAISKKLPEIVDYYKNNGTFNGYKFSEILLPVCAGEPIIKVSPNGKRIAINVRNCNKIRKANADYRCVLVDIENSSTQEKSKFDDFNSVSEVFAKDGPASCTELQQK